MPKKAPRTVHLKRRLTALFAIHNPHLDKYTILLASGIALFALSASGEPHHAEFHGEKGQTYRCELHKISDGDTVVATCDKQKIHIRLAGIDAPEMGQTPYSRNACPPALTCTTLAKTTTTAALASSTTSPAT